MCHPAAFERQLRSAETGKLFEEPGTISSNLVFVSQPGNSSRRSWSGLLLSAATSEMTNQGQEMRDDLTLSVRARHGLLLLQLCTL